LAEVQEWADVVEDRREVEEGWGFGQPLTSCLSTLILVARSGSYDPPVCFFCAVLGLAADPAVVTGAPFGLWFDALLVQLVTSPKVKASVKAANLNSSF
jgi:hypothetical protein